MASLSTPLLTTLLGLGAAILAISLLVQVVQELYKFLSSSKARCYGNVLEDFLGPWATRLRRAGVLPDFQARGPFQFRRLSPTGILLPLGPEALGAALERTASPWLRRALGALRLEADLQSGTPGALSAEWQRFLGELGEPGTGAPGSSELGELRAFLSEQELAGSPRGPNMGTVDATKALRLFQERFFSHVLDARRHYGRLEETFDYEYRRRNLRQTFLFGFLVAFLANQPVDKLYRDAAALPPDEAVAMAERVTESYRASRERADSAQPAPEVEAPPGGVAGEQQVPAAPDSVPQATPEDVQVAWSVARDALHAARLDRAAEFSGFAAFAALEGPWPMARHLLACLMTAILVSFGAPFWNDLVGLLLRIRQREPSRGPTAPTQREPADG